MIYSAAFGFVILFATAYLFTYLEYLVSQRNSLID
jgi:hypothetical protein